MSLSSTAGRHASVMVRFGVVMVGLGVDVLGEHVAPTEGEDVDGETVISVGEQS